MDPLVARKTWRTLEPYHGVIYFAPEAIEAFASLGLSRMAGYFASRSASMGEVSPELVIATFFNFHPELVRHAMTGVWQTTDPGTVTAARVAAADAVIRRALGSLVDTPEMIEAAELATEAANAATGYQQGRPLFAGHCTLPWPDQPHMVLWHAQMLLREFRGDGHIAALTVEGLGPLDVLILHAATGEVSRQGVQLSRRWSDDEWAAGVAALAERGLVDGEGQFTDAGRKQRKWIEARTDALAMVPYEALGEDRCAKLRALARPFSKAILGLNLFGN